MNSDGGFGASGDSEGVSQDAWDADDGAAGPEATNESERYVHRPREATPADDPVADATTGLRGWVLVSVVVTCFLVVPGVIYLRPAMPGQFGLTFVAAMLALPMLPALLLGLTAVWSMRGPRDEE